MKKVLLCLSFLAIGCAVFSQPVDDRLRSAFEKFENDSQLRHAISSLYVVDAATGQVVFDKNSQIGLAPASTQKIITSVTAYELLGSGFAYKTLIYADGKLRNDTLNGNLVIRASGDPTFGSWRYAATQRDRVLQSLVQVVKDKGIRHITGNIIIDDSRFEGMNIPDGWIFQDIGNYYGAGAAGLCWNENQYDVYLEAGNRTGDPVKVLRTDPAVNTEFIVSELKTGPPGSGDNAYVYVASGGFIKGTIPAGEKNFKISASLYDPASLFAMMLESELARTGVHAAGGVLVDFDKAQKGKQIIYTGSPLNTIVSPKLDSIIYWFNKKSINLYGEALVKTFSLERNGFGSTDSGVAIVRRFWKEKGLDDEELNIRDGSGLSPLNRVTTHAQVEILRFARNRPWYPSFLAALPEYNGMKMKSGTISDVKGFCGYHRSKSGREYIFSFLVNNYSGKTSGVVAKMYRVLDELK